jgi:hypothetical protein
MTLKLWSLLWSRQLSSHTVNCTLCLFSLSQVRSPFAQVTSAAGKQIRAQELSRLLQLQQTQGGGFGRDSVGGDALPSGLLHLKSPLLQATGVVDRDTAASARSLSKISRAQRDHGLVRSSSSKSLGTMRQTSATPLHEHAADEDSSRSTAGLTQRESFEETRSLFAVPYVPKKTKVSQGVELVEVTPVEYSL